MRRRLSEYGLFFREFVTNFHTTGAIMPSGGRLCRALARFVGEPADASRRILEVGPGTGAVTGRIVAAMQPDDQLDLVELNDRFVRRLRERFEQDAGFRPVSSRARVLHCGVEQLEADDAYDLVISGLPLNNFSVAAVEQILAALRRLLKPGGTMSFFEYIAVRRARALVGRRDERARLRGIGRAMDALLGDHEIRRDWIWPNVPPSWVHHVRIGGRVAEKA